MFKRNMTYLCFVFRQKCVLYSGKSDLLLAFTQRHGDDVVILSEMLGKGGGGGRSPQLKINASEICFRLVKGLVRLG